MNLQSRLKPVAIFPPSLGLVCPKARCGLQMTSTRQEDFRVVSCTCGYAVKEISGELKADYQASIFERTAQRGSR